MEVTKEYQAEICNDWSTYHDKKKTEIACKFADKCNKIGAAEIVHNGITHIMHKSTKEDRKCQVSCFIKGEAFSDSGELSLREAAYYMVEQLPPTATSRPDLSAGIALYIREGQYVYDLRARPLSIGTAPDGFINVSEGHRYERLTYKLPLTQKVIDQYELMPVGHKIEGEEFMISE